MPLLRRRVRYRHLIIREPTEQVRRHCLERPVVINRCPSSRFTPFPRAPRTLRQNDPEILLDPAQMLAHRPRRRVRISPANRR